MYAILTKLSVKLAISLLVYLLSISSVLAVDDNLSADRIKASFIYQIIKFCEWPEEKQKGDWFKIGIVDDGSLLKKIDAQPKKQIKGKNVIYQNINYDFSVDNLAQYHILFIRDSDSNKIPGILEITKNLAILTVSEMDKSAPPDTMFNFVLRNKKLRFQVDNDRAKAVGIKIHSKLLRLGL